MPEDSLVLRVVKHLLSGDGRHAYKISNKIREDATFRRKVLMKREKSGLVCVSEREKANAIAGLIMSCGCEKQEKQKELEQNSLSPLKGRKESSLWGHRTENHLKMIRMCCSN
jgi:hypothetical protein